MLEHLAHFTSRDAANIDGLGPKKINDLYLVRICFISYCEIQNLIFASTVFFVFQYFDFLLTQHIILWWCFTPSHLICRFFSLYHRIFCNFLLFFLLLYFMILRIIYFILFLSLLFIILNNSQFFIFYTVSFLFL